MSILSVIFKKYSPIGELSSFAEQYAEVLSRVSKQPILISDSDHIVAAAGVSKREFLERRISPQLEEYMENRKPFFVGKEGSSALLPIEGLSRSAAVMYPILSAGDVTGSVILLDNEQGIPPTEIENKLLQTAAVFLGKQMED